ASQRYGVGVSTIYDWMKTSKFPKPCKLGPKLVRFHIDDLQRWESQQIGTDRITQKSLWDREYNESRRKDDCHMC
ncbi:MAG: helix-turn-helix transcriptional regulator, partial [Endozoicomonas sp.]